MTIHLNSEWAPNVDPYLKNKKCVSLGSGALHLGSRTNCCL